MADSDAITKSISIDAPIDTVWEALTVPSLVQQWMAEPEMTLEVITDWVPGSDIIISGFHHTRFVNRGKVVLFNAPHQLAYNYLSSISRLPDKPGNYTLIGFALEQQDHQTILTVSMSNFPTKIIRHHVDFYWSGTLMFLKDFIEKRINKA